MCLSRAHELLAAHSWRGASINEVVEEALRPFDGLGTRFSADGPDVTLGPEAASGLLLILYELACNAQAFGAWSDNNGRVALGWTLDTSSQPPAFRLNWRESGGPAVSEPTRRGFGSRLIEHGLARAPAGGSKLSFEPDGVCFDLSAPLSDRIRAAA